ncbi:MAG: ATP-binding cassette domain-containing protein, partial [Gemmatimonadota bacterium]
PSRRRRARRALLRERLSSRRIGPFWLLRDAPGAPFHRQLLRAGSGRTLFLMMVAHGGYYVLWLLSWYLIGQAALSGRRPDGGWLLAWLLILLSAVPLRALVVHAQGEAGATVGALLKRRVLHGALRLQPDEIRREGAGRLLGRVLESEAVESLALNGGLSALLGVLELGMALLVLAAGAGGPLHAGALAVWVGAAGVLAWRYRRRHLRWTDTRREMTNDLVERMVGYRTRLAQREPARWHVEEDAQLERYLARSRSLDRTNAWIEVVVPRGWMILGLAGLAPAFAAGAPSAGALAVAFGGVLLGYRSLGRLAPALVQLPAASIAWRQVAPFFQAAARTPPIGVPEARAAAVRRRVHRRPDPGTAPIQDAREGREPSRIEQSSTTPVLDVQALRFGYARRGRPVIADLTLRLRHGDRVAIGGPSGSGKSTLVSLLVGLRSPDAGLLLLGGLDGATLGAASWRRRIAGVPQFHENHVLTGPLAFNLLMGRGWPPGPDDLDEAETVCRELGLGGLLDRMPSGLMQMVGDTGWRLSHGERSRIFLARALLQGADIIVLDESFAALDPETFARTLRCVDARAETVLAIAHS